MSSFALDRRRFLRNSVVLGAGALIQPQAQSAIDTHPEARFGLNCFDLFYGRLVTPGKTRHASARLREMRMLGGFPFVRFCCSPVWPREWKTYLHDPKKYFGLLDEVIAAAESQQVKLIPSLIWSAPNVSDLVNEPVSYWGKSGSLTREFMHRYVSEVIERYKASPAILMWEFGNEFSAYADLPNALKWWPRVSVDQGTPAERGKLDLIRAQDCAAALAHFGSLARSLDPLRPLSTGLTLPLPNAWNLQHNKFDSDSREDFRRAIRQQTPDPLDVISVHLYPYNLKKRFGSLPVDYFDVLAEVSAEAKASGKRLFVGEFGVEKMANRDIEKQEFRRMLDALIHIKPDWAALWVYDFWGQSSDWSASFFNDRRYQLEWLMQANQNG